MLYRVQLLRDRQEEERTATPSASTPDSHSEREGQAALTLDTEVSPGGTNFSQGQRQLIAMARALLRRSSIIILDEATSSIDFATDAKIQTAIRQEFGNSLLLTGEFSIQKQAWKFINSKYSQTVAHRLRTIIDYDRLIVLDEGRIVEFDTPLNLLQKAGGVFRTMCLKSGTYAELEAAAKSADQVKK